MMVHRHRGCRRSRKSASCVRSRNDEVFLLRSVNRRTHNIHSTRRGWQVSSPCLDQSAVPRHRGNLSFAATSSRQLMLLPVVQHFEVVVLPFPLRPSLHSKLRIRLHSFF